MHRNVKMIARAKELRRQRLYSEANAVLRQALEEEASGEAAWMLGEYAHGAALGHAPCIMCVGDDGVALTREQAQMWYAKGQSSPRGRAVHAWRMQLPNTSALLLPWADAGDDAWAQLRMSECMAAEERWDESIAWLERAARQGLAEAQEQLGDVLMDWDADETNPEAALPWYKEAASQGRPNAAGHLSELYAERQHLQLAGYWGWRAPPQCIIRLLNGGPEVLFELGRGAAHDAAKASQVCHMARAPHALDEALHIYRTTVGRAQQSTLCWLWAALVDKDTAKMVAQLVWASRNDPLLWA